MVSPQLRAIFSISISMLRSTTNPAVWHLNIKLDAAQVSFAVGNSREIAMEYKYIAVDLQGNVFEESSSRPTRAVKLIGTIVELEDIFDRAMIVSYERS